MVDDETVQRFVRLFEEINNATGIER